MGQVSGLEEAQLVTMTQAIRKVERIMALTTTRLSDTNARSRERALEPATTAYVEQSGKTPRLVLSRALSNICWRLSLSLAKLSGYFDRMGYSS